MAFTILQFFLYCTAGILRKDILCLFFVFACIEAELLREIKLTQEGTLDGVESGASPSDVTGGMAGKLARACNIARLQIPVFVVNSGRDAYLACQEGAIGERGTRIIS